MELISREEVNRLLHNQREMQSRVNQLPTYDACYLGSPCEYQNEDIKMLNPHPPVQYIAEIKISENEMEEIVRKAEQILKDSIVEWHPYPKEKPSESGYYLVTTDGIRNDVIDIAWFDAEMSGLLQWNKASDILAWAYLPKPYEEGAEEADAEKLQSDS